MNFLSVTPSVGLVVDTARFNEAMPPFVFLNWDAPTDHLQFWFDQGGDQRFLFEAIDPGYLTAQSSFRKLAGTMALQLAHWPNALPFVWADKSELRAVDVILGGPVQVLDTALFFNQPVAHPNGKLYWLAAQTFAIYRVMAWDPLTGASPQTLATVNSDLPFHSWHRKNGQDFLIYRKEFNMAGVIDLATGTEVAQHSIRINTPLFSEFADQAVDRFATSTYGGAYGGRNPINIAFVENDEYDSALHAIARGTPGSSSIPSGIEVAQRFNLSRQALSVYPYLSINSGRLKFFDPSKTNTEPPNNNDSEAVVLLPTLDPSDPATFPHQVFPATVEPF